MSQMKRKTCQLTFATFDLLHAVMGGRAPLAFQLAVIKKRTPLALLPAVGLLRQSLLPAVDLLP